MPQLPDDPAAMAVYLARMHDADMQRLEEYDRYYEPEQPLSYMHLPYVFERFKRVVLARSRATGGTGIGLTIARALVRAHDADMRADSAGPGCGAPFIVTLPTDCRGARRRGRPRATSRPPSIYTDDIEHDAEGAPGGALRGSAAAKHRYEQLLNELLQEKLERTHSYYGDDFCVIEHLCVQIVGQFAGMPGDGRRISLCDHRQSNAGRTRVELWRLRGYPDVTPTTRRLLECWNDPDRDNPILFCQREAVETAIYVVEAAQESGDAWIRNALDEANREHNNGLGRLALKMATGSGKTVVMAMTIAWQTLNKVAAPQDSRFAKRFLVVTPGITIRDRLRVCRHRVRFMAICEDNGIPRRESGPVDAPRSTQRMSGRASPQRVGNHSARRDDGRPLDAARPACRPGRACR